MVSRRSAEAAEAWPDGVGDIDHQVRVSGVEYRVLVLGNDGVEETDVFGI